MSHLQRNLQALQQHRPELLRVLASFATLTRHRFLPAPSGALTIADVSDPARSYALTPGGDPATALPNILQQLEPLRAKGQPMGVLGAGDGYLLAALAQDHPQLFMDQQAAIWVIEPDPELFVACLMLHDYAQTRGPIADPAFRFFVGPRWREELDQAMRTDLFLPPPAFFVHQHRHSASLGQQAQASIQLRVQLQNQLLQSLEAFYLHRRDFAADQTGSVCLLTSRFTTVLQHSARQLLEGFAALGWRTHLIIEPAPYCRCGPAAILRALDTHRPDLFVMLDHLRRSTGDILPSRLPVASYVQDLLPHLTHPHAGRDLSARDFVLTFARPMFVSQCAYPARQCLDAPMMFAPLAQPARVAPPVRFDLAYVSHLGQTPQALCEEMLRQASDSLRPLLAAACRAVMDRYQAGQSVPTKHHVAGVVDAAALDADIRLAPEIRQRLIDTLWNPLNITLYRQQSLAWVAQAADELELNLAIFGNGWDTHPRFARYAKGPIDPGQPLRDLFQRTRINLSLEPYTCVSHSRLLTGLAVGAFFLIRDHPTHRLIQQLLLGEPDQSLPPDARCLCFGDDADPVGQARSLLNAGVADSNGCVLPRLGDVSFSDAAGVRQLLIQYIQDDHARNEIAEVQRQSIVERLSATVVARRMIQQIASRLAQADPSELFSVPVPA